VITTNCTITDYVCKTALKTYTPYTEAQLANPALNSCESVSDPSPYKYTCTDNQNVYATPSASQSTATISGTVQISSFSGRAADSLFNWYYLSWVTSIMILISLGILTFLTFMKRR